MSGISRRAFLIRSSMGAAAAAVMTAVPGLPSVVTTSGEEAPAADEATASVLSSVSSAQPLIAHVSDLRSGQISLFVGEREFTVVDKGLAGRLFGAAK